MERIGVTTEPDSFVKRGEVIGIESNLLELCPTYDFNGDKVENPFTYWVHQALTSLAWRLNAVPMQLNTSFSIQVSIKRQDEYFWVVAEVVEGLEIGED